MATTSLSLRTPSRHYARSALLVQRAVRQAQKARPGGLAAVTAVVVANQMAQARMSQAAVAAMLAEQQIESAADALLNLLAFTTATPNLLEMLDAAGDLGFDRLIAALITDAGRSAESVSVAVRPQIAHVRFLSPPSCARCAILAGRVYRWSDGFERHPNCDCVMIPTTVANADSLIHDPVDLLRRGLITTSRKNKRTGEITQRPGLSEADTQAILDGADFAKVVNIRSAAAGLRESGRVLARRGSLTPEGIYRLASDRAEAVALLRKYRFIL